MNTSFCVSILALFSFGCWISADAAPAPLEGTYLGTTQGLFPESRSVCAVRTTVEKDRFGRDHLAFFVSLGDKEKFQQVLRVPLHVAREMQGGAQKTFEWMTESVPFETLSENRARPSPVNGAFPYFLVRADRFESGMSPTARYQEITFGFRATGALAPHFELLTVSRGKHSFDGFDYNLSHLVCNFPF